VKYLRPASFPNQVGHERHRLPLAAVDVLREYVEYRAEDGRSSLDPPNKRAEVLWAL